MRSASPSPNDAQQADESAVMDQLAPPDAELSGPDAAAAHDAGADWMEASTREAAAPAADAGTCGGDACITLSRCDDQLPCLAPESVCVAGACQLDPGAPDPRWQRTIWSGRVGLVDGDDVTWWCTPQLEQAAGTQITPARLSGRFQRVALDGSPASERATRPRAAQRVRAQCFADAARTGASSFITSAWSTPDQDAVTLQCPRAQPYAAFARCQLAAEGEPALAYAGPTCGDGAMDLTGKASLRGQLLGARYKLGAPNKPLFNDTGAAGVVGTDLGFQFLAQGRMYLGFGDTWENELQVPGPNGYRGSVLAYTHDFEPGDDNGIAFEGWETSPERPQIAREVIPSAHDQSGATEFTAIATAGFGLSEGATHYRFLWFAAIKTWSPLTTLESTLAWSENGAPFVRGDQAPAQHPPRWPFDSFFGPGATWVDRERGYVYFFGVRTYQAGFPLRVARVRATVAAVRDHHQYEYWTGSDWQRPDPQNEYALARLDERAADLLPGSPTQNNRPEFSVSYNPYVDRFTLLVHNDATPFANEPETYLELWQAKAPEGPWTRVDTQDHLVLPPGLYGPYHSEQTFSEGGRDVSFALSDWNLLPLALGQPYIVGLWKMQLARRLRAGCTP